MSNISRYIGIQELHQLKETVQRLTAPGKGIFAADQSPPTFAKLFSPLGIDPTAENRHNFLKLLFTTPGIEAYLSGIILHEEMLAKKNENGQLFSEFLEERGVVPGVKIDKGLIPFTRTENKKAFKVEETITLGRDSLLERLFIYKNLSASFGKFRTVFRIYNTEFPSEEAKKENIDTLALVALLCQTCGMVPILEPEILSEGTHSLEQCKIVTEAILSKLFENLRYYKVSLENIIIKPSMVIPGNEHQPQPSEEKIIAAMSEALLRTVPAAVPSINFLSGGQPYKLATERLNAINKLPRCHPWLLSFSYGRALLEPALKIWNGKLHKAKEAQRTFYKRAKLNGAATKGLYLPSMETEEESEPAFV